MGSSKGSEATIKSCLKESEARLALSATVVGGVELRDATWEKVSAAPAKLESDD